jgi:squalene-hopene/tetraprenyl-beta-curcumene cyclase
MKRLITTATLLLAATCAAVSVEGAPARKPGSQGGSGAVKARIAEAAGKGITFLRGTQEKDGSWQHYPGITAVCLMGFLRSGITVKDPAVAKACDYLAGLAKTNGAIFTDQFGPAQALPNYNTALSLMALHASGSPKYAAVVKNAQRFLEATQFDEGEGFGPSNRQYGGIGYGSKEDNPDLSNLQNALEALKESGYPKNGEAFKKAIIFLQRCQNRKESNDQPWSGTDGGFIYAASGESKADEYTKQPHSSYGSMTYAGLKSYLYCSVTRSDPRVQAAWNWLRANYDVRQNPKMGLDGLYYYYHTMSKTLALLGEKQFLDSAGKGHPWAADLSGALLEQQRPDGSWANTVKRWWEDRADLATGYSLITLANCKQGL